MYKRLLAIKNVNFGSDIRSLLSHKYVISAEMEHIEGKRKTDSPI